jgi:replicative DNA helicase
MSEELSFDDFEDAVETPPAKPAPRSENLFAKRTQSLSAEEAVIGAILIDEGVLDSVADIAPPEMFASDNTRVILQGMMVLRARKEVIDVVTVHGYLQSRNYTHLGPLLASCVDTCVYAKHAPHYARVIAGVHYEKLVVIKANKFAETQERSDLDELSKALMAKERLGLPLLFSYEKNLHGAVDDVLDQARLPTCDTGFAVLDSVLLGVRGGEVIVWGAAPNVGKSITLLNIAHVTVRTKRGLYMGTEMSALETFQRHLSIENGVEPWKLRKGKLNPTELQSINDSVSDKMSQMPFFICDLPSPTIKDIDDAITASGAEVVFLDYLEQFTLPPAENFRLQVSEFMRQIKNLARRRNVIIHLASQLSRSTYGKDERRPTMADLSESSGIEKAADRIILLWAPKEKQSLQPGSRLRMIEAILEKNRHGKKGLVFDLVMDEGNLRISPDEAIMKPLPGNGQVYLPGQQEGERND